MLKEVQGRWENNFTVGAFLCHRVKSNSIYATSSKWLYQLE
ncbi:hypothetical protein BDD14_5072 [Edaphobacter modestus]|uniref:Uncharacterized protein n=1 Tax=Edaphobacter modestus TaxID=388466 RepID=A0A4Q7Z1J2_9BACT|nr:hypothetical protein BDD14_5072 [Edaphobacter modestus]